MGFHIHKDSRLLVRYRQLIIRKSTTCMYIYLCIQRDGQE